MHGLCLHPIHQSCPFGPMPQYYCYPLAPNLCVLPTCSASPYYYYLLTSGLCVPPAHKKTFSSFYPNKPIYIFMSLLFIIFLSSYNIRNPYSLILSIWPCSSVSLLSGIPHLRYIYPSFSLFNYTSFIISCQ